MSDLKFSCPSCGQHIQCDAAHAGENIPCPGCALLIRVPRYGEIVVNSIAADNPFAVPDESKVSYTSAGAGVHNAAEESTNTNSHETKRLPPSIAERERQIAAAREVRTVSVNPVMKPRLDYILNGGSPSPLETNSTGTSEPVKKPKPDIHTIQE